MIESFDLIVMTDDWLLGVTRIVDIGIRYFVPRRLLETMEIC